MKFFIRHTLGIIFLVIIWGGYIVGGSIVASLYAIAHANDNVVSPIVMAALFGYVMGFPFFYLFLEWLFNITINKFKLYEKNTTT